MEVNEKVFEEPVEFLNFLSSWNNNLKGYVFRGHSSEKYELTPSVLRNENRYLSSLPFGTKNQETHDKHSDLETLQIQAEFTLLREFYKTADRHGLKVPSSDYLRKYLAGEYDYNFILSLTSGDIWIPPHLQEVAALAQHYGLPTRLLDWTYDPYVAAHFALKGAIGNNGNLVVWCLNANKIAEEINFDPQFPLKIITPPYFDNENLAAQKGLFTHIETSVSALKLLKENQKVDRRSLNEFVSNLPSNTLYTEKNFMIKLTMPCKCAHQAYVLLESHGYGEARIYPGYNGIVKQIMRARKPNRALWNK